MDHTLPNDLLHPTGQSFISYFHSESHLSKASSNAKLREASWKTMDGSSREHLPKPVFQAF